MASGNLQLPPEIKERVEELEQELREGNIYNWCFRFVFVPVPTTLEL